MYMCEIILLLIPIRLKLRVSNQLFIVAFFYHTNRSSLPIVLIDYYTMSSHNRSAHVNISNDDQYRIDFPLELTRLDYLRRILNHIGGAFLITHHRVLEIQKVI